MKTREKEYANTVEIDLLPLTSDVVFKAAYGRDTPECKRALIGLLNIILDRTEDPIVDLIYKNPFSYAEYAEDKTIIMDIKVVTLSGEWIGVEMQVEILPGFVRRALFYNARLFSEQLQSGEEYDKIKKTIIISIVRGTLFPQTKGPLSIFRYKEINENFKLTDLSELYFLELGKIDTSKEPDQMTAVERLGAFLLLAAEPDRRDYVKRLAEQEEMIGMADEILKKISGDDKLRFVKEAREMGLIYRSIEMGAAKAEGREEGREEGRAQGRIEGKAEGKREGQREGASKVNELNQRLIADKRMDDLTRSAVNSAYQEQLMKEYGI